MALTLYMTRGLPGSGKTTWAKTTISERPVASITRVNKDELRQTLHLGQHSKVNEQIVVAARDAVIAAALSRGQHVIVDDTNFSPKHEARLRDLAKTHNAQFELVDFTDVPLHLCLRRNRERTDKDPVPGEVIHHYHRTYIIPNIEVPSYDPMLPHAVIVDLDGTLAHMNGRGPYEWEKVDTDTVDTRVLDFIGGILEEGGRQVIILSGRDGSCRDKTTRWLARHGLDPATDYLLLMRPAGDSRRDSIVKRELFEAYVAPYFYPYLVLDDRDQVVRMWRDELGLTVWQVADGDF